MGSRHGAPTRRTVLQWGVAGLGAAIGASLIPTRPAHAEAPTSLYAAARTEGGLLNLYAGGYSELYAPWARAFEAAFPGIRVNGTAGFDQVLASRIDAQRAAGKPEVDLVILQALQHLERWKRERALLEFRPDGIDAIPDRLKDADATSVPVALHALGYAYNLDEVAARQVPRSAPDFLRPEFRGRILSTYPQDEDSTLFLYSTLVEKYGWQFLDGLMASAPRFVRGHLGLAHGVGAGQAAVSFDSLPPLTLYLLATGVPTDLAISPVDALPVWPETAAIFRDAPHPNAAKLFLSWYLAKDQQRQIGTWSPRGDVEPPPRLKPLAAYRIATGYGEFVRDESRKADLRSRLEKYIGPPEGPPIR